MKEKETTDEISNCFDEKERKKERYAQMNEQIKNEKKILSKKQILFR